MSWYSLNVHLRDTSNEYTKIDIVFVVNNKNSNNDNNYNDNNNSNNNNMMMMMVMMTLRIIIIVKNALKLKLFPNISITV